MQAQSLQSCLFLCDPMDCSPPGFSVHRIIQARILERVAISYSRGPSQPRDQTQVSHGSCIGRRILYHWATWEAPFNIHSHQNIWKFSHVYADFGYFQSFKFMIIYWLEKKKCLLLISISPMVSGVKHVYICLLVTCIWLQVEVSSCAGKNLEKTWEWHSPLGRSRLSTFEVGCCWQFSRIE